MKTNTPERWEDGILITADQRETATLRNALAYAVENVPGSPLGRNALPLRDVLDKLLSVGTEQADPAPSEPTDSAKLAAIRDTLQYFYLRVLEASDKPVPAGESLFRALLYVADTARRPTFPGNQVRFDDDQTEIDYDGYGERLYEQAVEFLQARAEERADSLEGFDPHDV